MLSGPKLLNRRVFYPGDVIFNEGDLGNQAYVLQSGRVRIEKTLSSRESITLGHVDPGGIFGEMALIDNSPRMASAIADQSSVCITISEDVLRMKLSRSDPAIRMIILMLIRLLRRTAEDIPISRDDLDALAKAAEQDDVNP